MSELGSRQDFPGHQRYQTWLLQSRSLYRRTAFIATETIGLQGLASHALAPQRLYSEERELRLWHVPRDAAAGTTRAHWNPSTVPLEATLSRATVVEDAVGSPLADSPAIDEKLRLSRHDALQHPDHRSGRWSPQRVPAARASKRLPPESTLALSRDDALQQQDSGVRRRSRSVFRRVDCDSVPRLELRRSPIRIDSLSRRRGIMSALRGGSAVHPTANSDRRQRVSTAFRARVTSQPTVHARRWSSKSRLQRVRTTPLSWNAPRRSVSPPSAVFRSDQLCHAPPLPDSRQKVCQADHFQVSTSR
jgi:hypothetical protein